MNEFARKAAIAITGTGIALAAPVVPQDMEWVGSYETVAFDTADGDLGMNEYAIAGPGEWYIREVPKTRGQFTATTSSKAIEGRKQVAIRAQKGPDNPNCIGCAYYSTFRASDGTIVRVPFEGRYDDLRSVKNAKKPERIEWTNAISASRSAAAIAVDGNTNAGNEATASSFAFNHAVSSGTALVVVYMGEDLSCTDNNATAVTFNGASMVPEFESTCPTNISEARVEFFSLANPDAGSSYVVSVTLAGSVLNPGANALSFTGVDTTDIIGPNTDDTTNTGSGATTATITTTVDDSWVLGGGICTGGCVGGESNPVSPALQLYEQDVDTIIHTAYVVSTSTGSYSLGWTNNGSDDSIAAIVELIALASTGGIYVTEPAIIFE